MNDTIKMNDEKTKEFIYKVKTVLQDKLKEMKPNGRILIAINDKTFYKQFFGNEDVEKRHQRRFKHNTSLVQLQNNLQQ